MFSKPNIIAFAAFAISGIIAAALFIKFSSKIRLTKRDAGKVVIAIIFACLCISQFVDLDKSMILIAQTGEKNENSSGTEVWVTHIICDGHPVDLSTVRLSDKWELKNNQLHSRGKNRSDLKLFLNNGAEVKLSFITHAWSGIAEISVSGETIQLDLFESDTTRFNVDYEFTLQPNPLPFAEMIFVYLALIMMVFGLSIPLFMLELGVLLLIKRLKVLSLLLIMRLNALSKSMLVKMNEADTGIFARALRAMRRYITVPNILLIIFAALYAAIALSFDRLFLLPLPEYLGEMYINLSFSYQSIVTFALSTLLAFFIILIALYLLNLTSILLSRKTISKESKTKRINDYLSWLVFFLIPTAIFTVYWMAFFPGNLTSDTYAQWLQVTGAWGYDNGNPVFHTLILKLLSNFWYTPAAIIPVQIVCFSAVCASFLRYLYQRGLNFWALCAFIFTFALLPNNGIHLVTVWKDIPYTISLLWLTYL